MDPSRADAITSPHLSQYHCSSGFSIYLADGRYTPTSAAPAASAAIRVLFPCTAKRCW
jgi:hypothetical protein